MQFTFWTMPLTIWIIVFIIAVWIWFSIHLEDYEQFTSFLIPIIALLISIGLGIDSNKVQICLEPDCIVQSFLSVIFTIIVNILRVFPFISIVVSFVYVLINKINDGFDLHFELNFPFIMRLLVWVIGFIASILGIISFFLDHTI